MAKPNLKSETIKVQSLPSGDTLNIRVFKFVGSGKNKVYVQANIHGPELTGVLVAKKLVEYVKSNGGNFSELIVVPSCNPMGLNSQFIGQQIGYVNQLTGKNWNRIYPDLSVGINQKKITLSKFKKELKANLKAKLSQAVDLETKLGLTLLNLSFNADIVLDLHTVWGKAPHYVYCYPEYLGQAKKFGIKNIFLLSENEFFGVFDEANLYPYLKFKSWIKDFRLPKQVYTVEFGSDCSLDEENIEKSWQELKCFLQVQAVLWGKTKLTSINYDICLNKNYVYYYAAAGGLLIWKKKPGEYISSGEVIGEIHSLDLSLPTKVIAKHHGKLMIQFNAVAVHQGQQTCKVMTEIKKEKHG